MTLELTSNALATLVKAEQDCFKEELVEAVNITLDCLPSATDLFQSLLLVCGTVCLNGIRTSWLVLLSLGSGHLG